MQASKAHEHMPDHIESMKMLVEQKAVTEVASSPTSIFASMSAPPTMKLPEAVAKPTMLCSMLNVPATCAQADALLCLYSAWASVLSVANAVADEPRTLSSLPAELLAIVAENLDTHCLARFAAASSACLAAAQDELHARAALLAAVKHCLEPGGIGTLAAWCIGGMDALVSQPHFRLPNDLVSIPSRAFAGSTSLTQLTLPATVTTIGDGAFAGCCSLTELTIPTNAALTKIGSRAFKGTALTSITLPATVTTISHRAFKHCASLTSVTLPDTVTTIGIQAFYGSSLSELTLPAALTTLGERAVPPCTCLKHPWSMHPPNHPGTTIVHR